MPDLGCRVTTRHPASGDTKQRMKDEGSRMRLQSASLFPLPSFFSSAEIAFMPTNVSSGSSLTIPPGADDFTEIRGLNPKMASRLYEAGILTYDKLAAMTPEEIVDRLTRGQKRFGASIESIIKKDWIGQARELALKQRPETAAQESVQPAVLALQPGGSGLHKLEVFPASSDYPSYLVHRNQPFNVRLSLDLDQIAASIPGSISYSVSIHAKNLEGRQAQTVGQLQGIIKAADNISIGVEGLILSEGVYRLGAAVTLDLDSEDPAQRTNHTAYLESGILQVS
jgi:hypothetical protein